MPGGPDSPLKKGTGSAPAGAADPGNEPHEVLLVLDATIGQNAINQAKIFSQSVQVSGLFLAKLDGSAKGGIVVGIRDQLDIPVKFVGLGETIDAIEPFDPEAFVEALFAGL